MWLSKVREREEEEEIKHKGVDRYNIEKEMRSNSVMVRIIIPLH